MSAQRAELVVAGRVVLAAEPDGLETAEAIGIAAGRVVSAGTRSEVTDAAARGARVIDAGEAAVIPGLHDFHIHLVGLARTRGAIALDDAADGAEVAARIAAAARAGDGEAWLTGRGWSERQLAGLDAGALDAAAGERLAFLTSHDGHSAWASPAARRLAGLGAETPDPPGGRLERGAGGEPTGILRETAMDLVAPLVTRLQGAALRDALDATLRELAAFGVTGASEAGDYTDRNGIGADAALGDSYSTLTDLGDLVDGRLRLTLGIPADAVPAAAERALRTGAALEGRTDDAVRLGQGVRGWSARLGHRGAVRAALLRNARCGHPASVAGGARCALRGRSLGGNRAGGACHRRPGRRGRPRRRRARAGAPVEALPRIASSTRSSCASRSSIGSRGWESRPASSRSTPLPIATSSRHAGMAARTAPTPGARCGRPERTWRPDRTRRSNRSIPGSACSRPSTGACRPIREATGDPRRLSRSRRR